MTVACRDVEAAPLACDGSPPITRTTFPTCRAHYPGGSSGCACRLLPRSRGLPKWQEGRHPHCHFRGLLRLHSRYGPPDCSPPKATFVTRLQPFRLPGRAARQLPDQSTTLWVESSSTDDSALRGALPNSDANKLIRRPQKKKPPRRRLFNTGRCGVGQRFSRVYSRPTQPTCAPDRALPLTLKRALIEQANRLYYPVGNPPVCSFYTAQEMIR